MTPNVPIVNAGLLYANGLELAFASDSTFTIAAGAARDSTDTNDITLSASVTVDATVNGANGLDQGALANSTQYAVFLIGDSTQYNATAGLISASATAPVMPVGYDMVRRIGWIRTDGSADFLEFQQVGDGNTRKYFYDNAISVLAAGTSATFASASLAAAVPAIATLVYYVATFDANVAGDQAGLRAYGSASTAGQAQLSSSVTTAPQVAQLVCPCGLNAGAPTVQYIVDASGSLDLAVAGFEDYL